MAHLRALLIYSLVIGSILLIPTYLITQSDPPLWLLQSWRFLTEVIWVSIAIGWAIFAGRQYISQAPLMRLLIDLIIISLLSLLFWILWLFILYLTLGGSTSEILYQFQIWFDSISSPNLWNNLHFWIQQTARLLIVSYITLLLTRWLVARNRWTGQTNG